MLRTLFISLLCLLGTTRALAWGQKGHDVVAYIAECNLTPEAAEKIDKILGGASMVYWANWLDSASHTPEYAYTATWHYANVDEGFTYETMTKNPDGDIVEAIDRIVAELKNGQLDPAQEQLYLKMLIHLVGDLHQPMHTGALERPGRQLRSRTVLRSGEQSPCSLGQLPARSGPQVELYGVAKPARSPHRRGGGPNPIRHTVRLVRGEQCDLSGDIRCNTRRQRSFLRLHR